MNCISDIVWYASEPTLGLYAIHKPLPLGLRPRVSGFINHIQTSHMVYNYYIYTARLIIEHPREWLASLADYPAHLRAGKNLLIGRAKRDTPLIGERSEPLSMVFNDQPRDISESAVALSM